MIDYKTSDLLKSLVKVGDWNKAPAEAMKVARKLDEEYGGNVAVGNHPILGWFVLHDQGYGVGLVWKEKGNTNESLELSSISDAI